jgi:photosystem II stability/assembly factor-like uncharacterized protein
MAHIHPRPVHLALLVCLVSMTASANGAFPDEFSVHFPATAPHRILVGANFGLVVSEDDGATWRYACEPWITQGSDVALSPYSVNYYQVTVDAAVLAQSLHLTRSADDACTWPQSSGSIDNGTVSDIFADPSDATFAVAIMLDSSGKSSIVASHDGGKTFDSTPIFAPTSDILIAIEIAKSNSQVIYATSISPNGSHGPLLWVSQDRGTTWTSKTITGEAAGTQPRIIAIDPEDASVVYLRETGAQTDSIVIASATGTQFNTALTITGQFAAFVRGSDKTLYAATAAIQLYVHAPADPISQWTQLAGPQPHFRCLGQRPGTTRLYACGDFTIDGFSLGYSDDGGKTWIKMMNFTDILGPLTCAPVSTNCQAHWERIQQVLGIGDGGTNDAGSQSGGGSTPPPAKKSSCSSGAAGLGGLLSIAWLLARRRARWSRNRSP